jgi:hypothetical protein
LSSIVEPDEYGRTLNAILDPRLNGWNEEIASLPLMPVMIRRSVWALRLTTLVFPVVFVAKVSGLLPTGWAHAADAVVSEGWLPVLCVVWATAWIENRYRDTRRPRR